MSLTTMPTPAQVKVPCKAQHPTGKTCTRKGRHTRHINFRANVAWTDSKGDK